MCPFIYNILFNGRFLETGRDGEALKNHLKHAETIIEF